MRFVGFVVLPFLVQLLFVLGTISLATGNGSFVGLAAMGLGLWVLPITALINWLGARQPRFNGQGNGKLALRTAVVTASFPIFLLVMAAVAS